MVREKTKNDTYWLQELFTRLEEERGTKLGIFRYAVHEHVPAKRVSDEYDFHWEGGINALVSEWYDTQEEAQAFIDSHESDGTLSIRRQELYERVVREWH